MASRNSYILPMTSIVEIVAMRGSEILKKEMTYGEALNLKRKKGWRYKIYQLGFSQFNILKKARESIDMKASHGRENNLESNTNYQDNLDSLNKNCRVILEQLLTGQRLSGLKIIELGILEYRKRIDDLKKIHGIPVKSEYPIDMEGNKLRYKEWWLEMDFINEFLGSTK